MEKKTIGNFIAALRRAKGLTQRQLAEMLNVSDKAVSRWERDECAPDLMLIPVIADIFGVSSDEILRGERVSQETDGIRVERYSRERSEKALFAVLSRKKADYSSVSIVIYGCVTIAVIAAMICNIGFLRAYIGFFIATAILTVTSFLLAITLHKGMSSVNTDEFPSDAVNDIRRWLISVSKREVTVIIGAFAFVLPLLVFIPGAYCGLMFGEWLIYGTIFTVLAVLICKAVFSFTFSLEVSKGLYNVTDEELEDKKDFNVRLRRFLIRLGIATVILFAFIIVFNETVSPSMFSGSSFDSYEDAQEYLNSLTSQLDYTEEFYIENRSGDVIYVLKAPEFSVFSVSVGNPDTCLPITIHTYDDLQRGKDYISCINIAVVAVFIIAVTVMAFDLRRHTKRRETNKKI